MNEEFNMHLYVMNGYVWNGGSGCVGSCTPLLT
jgi:hypothetical protein